MPYSDQTWSDPYLSLSWEIKEGVAADLDEGDGVPVEFEVTVDSEAAVGDGEPRPAELAVDTAAGMVGDNLIELSGTNTADWRGRIVGNPKKEYGILARLYSSDGEVITREGLKMPPVSLLAHTERIRRSGLDDEMAERFRETVSGEDRFEVFRGVQQKLTGTLPDEDYYVLVAALADAHERFREWWAPQIHFRNRVVGWGPPRSVDGLREALQAHNEQDALPEVALEDVLERVAQDLQSIEEITANRIRQSFGRLELCIAGESEALALNELAAAVRDDQYDLVPALVEHLVEVWSEPVSTDDDYEIRKERAKQAAADERPTAWLEVLVDALDRERNERRYVLANFLYWKGRIERAELPFSAELQTAAAKLLGSIEANTFSLRASFNARVDRGHSALYDDNETAAEEFTAALSYAAASGADWDGVDADYAYAYTMSVVAEVRQLVGEGANGEALELVTREREAIENHTDPDAIEVLASKPGAPQSFRAVSPEMRRDQSNRLAAEQCRVEARVAAYQGDFTGALESVRNAKDLYSELSANRARFAVYQFELTLEAIQHERNLQFETARDAYHADALSGRMPEVRSDICEIKRALLAREYDTARATIDSFNTGRFESSEVDVLDTLTHLLSDYETGGVTDLDKIPHTLDRAVASFTGFDLPLGTDYRVVILLAAAAQHVRDSPVDDELFDLLIRTTLRDALVPALATEPTAGDHLESVLEPELEDLSVEEIRHQTLPLPVVNQVNQAEVDMATGAGARGVGLEFWNALELAVKLSAEYYIKTELSPEEWHNNVAGEAFGATAESLFQKDEGSLLNNRLERVTELRDVVEEGQQSDKETVQYMRNKMVVHPEKPPLNEDELDAFRKRILELLDDIAVAIPVVCTVGSSIEAVGYRVRLHWNRPLTKALLITDAEMQENAVYYFPPGQVKAEAVELPANKIVKCENEYVLGKINEATQTSME